MLQLTSSLGLSMQYLLHTILDMVTKTSKKKVIFLTTAVFAPQKKLFFSSSARGAILLQPSHTPHCSVCDALGAPPTFSAHFEPRPHRCLQQRMNILILGMSSY